MSPRRLLRLSWWRRPENLRLAASLVAAAAGITLGVWALVIAQGAQGENRRDIDATQAAALVSCRLGNVARPQIAANTLVVVDGVLKGLEAGLPLRRAAARAAVQALRPELAENGSAGPRDCTGDGRISDDDYPPGRPPRPLLGPDGLPRGARP